MGQQEKKWLGVRITNEPDRLPRELLGQRGVIGKRDFLLPGEEKVRRIANGTPRRRPIEHVAQRRSPIQAEPVPRRIVLGMVAQVPLAKTGGPVSLITQRLG